MNLIPDIIRSAAIMAAVYDFFLIPVLVWQRTAKNRKVLVEVAFIGGLDLLLLGTIAQAISRYNQPLLWWGAPMTLVACLCLARSAEIGILAFHKERRRGKSVH